MKFKFKYEDSSERPHIRYYNALDLSTAEEMFRETVSHSIKEPVVVREVFVAQGGRWVNIPYQSASDSS
tara:strand:+ start:633 stop:839 length:207 start_codon:yes stop_codon:yes gene_type:complete